TPQEYVSLEGEDMELFERLMNLLNACDDVDKIYHNFQIIPYLHLQEIHILEVL
ncbi:YebC/PmpR family DNA-binding transcriptional regulator, partial [Faecalibacillus intestinalis]|uniref:YebC/PmpR family DNA-binding transcriptional regulator n=1 Tax=Faecalibacillus intestinalis TaxID=1982626 RepID=UPI0039959426